ncbi:MAG: hypothetical protein AMJ53_17330, partial [Gammaproteobacteria bacterium SG8_11]
MTSEVNVAFIIGTGRCGTSLLGQMLNSHSEICVPPELQLIAEYDGNGDRLFEEFSLCGPEDIDADKLSSIIERCCPHKLELFFDYNAYCHREGVLGKSLAGFVTDFYESIAKSYGKSWLIEQTPWYGQRLDILTNLFPRAKFIHMIRDGRDVALSFARTPWWYRSVHLNLARWQREIKKISVDAAMYLNNSSYLEVKYENLVINTEFEVRRICDFLGEGFEVSTIDPQCFIDYDKYSRLDTKNISSKEYGEWKKNKNSAVFPENVQAWKRVNGLFSGALPTEITDALCRYGYDSGGEDKASDSELQRDYEYSVKNYIDSLEDKIDHLRHHITGLEQAIADQTTHIRNVEADWTARGRHIVELEQAIADQATHIDNVEADWSARGQHIVELEKHNTELEQILADQTTHIRNLEADWKARGQHIVELEQVIADQTTHIRDLETDWKAR